MIYNILLLIKVAIVLILIDSIYLYTVSNYFNKQIFSIQKSEIKLELVSAIICYLFLVFGIYYFIIKDKRPIFDAFLLGMVIYMVYETTNKAILKNWNWKTVLLDGVWGGILFALTTYIIYNYLT